MESKHQLMLDKLSQAFADIPFNRMLGLSLGDVSADAVAMTFKMKDELVGNFIRGILHGGVISSVLDMAGGMAAMAASLYKNLELPPEKIVETVGRCRTIDLTISYLLPGKGDFFTAKAYLTHRGSRISFARMELLNPEEKLIATGTGTYLIT